MPWINLLPLARPAINALVGPQLAALIMALALGHPEISDELVGICMRESRCSDVGIHVGDAYMSPEGWHGQVGLGHLDPSCQPHELGAWATRGAWGLSAAAHWRYLPRCYSPAVLDVHLVSAWVAARKYLARCHRRRWAPRPAWWVRWCHVRRKKR